VSVKVTNKTDFSPGPLLSAAFAQLPVDGLTVLINYMRRDAKAAYSGLYRPDDLFIRVSVNRNNIYPVPFYFYTSVYEKDPGDPQRYYRGLRATYMPDGESLIMTVLLHELSHYSDHLQGLNLNRKETKADQYALRSLMRIQRQAGRKLVLRPESSRDRQWIPQSQLSLTLTATQPEELMETAREIDKPAVEQLSFS
jgi:hypothetical protein